MQWHHDVAKQHNHTVQAVAEYTGCEMSMLLMEVVTVVCETSSLIWARHVQICFDIPEGLSYLQSNMNDKLNVIHRDIKSANIDIKSANIVLDDVWNSKDRRLWPL